MVPDDGSDPRGVRGGRHKLLGPRGTPRVAPPNPAPPAAAPHRALPATNPSKPRAAAPRAAKKRVLFVCIGNSCRSQMAEAFARAYGSDIMDVSSAGVSPAAIIAPLTKQVLAERNLTIDDQFPKTVAVAAPEPVDVVVNMSGIPLPLPGARRIEWRVEDPIGQKESVYRTVASQIEGLVMGLIIELRAHGHPKT